MPLLVHKSDFKRYKDLEIKDPLGGKCGLRGCKGFLGGGEQDNVLRQK